MVRHSSRNRARCTSESEPSKALSEKGTDWSGRRSVDEDPTVAALESRAFFTVAGPLLLPASVGADVAVAAENMSLTLSCLFICLDALATESRTATLATALPISPAPSTAVCEDWATLAVAMDQSWEGSRLDWRPTHSTATRPTQRKSHATRRPSHRASSAFFRRSAGVACQGSKETQVRDPELRYVGCRAVRAVLFLAKVRDRLRAVRTAKRGIFA
jgi:hypothetical protein